MAEQHSKSPGARAAEGTKSRSGNGNGSSWPFAMSNIPDAMRAQTEAWFAGQTGLFAGIQTMMAERMTRCQEGAAASMKAFEKLCASRNGADAMSAYQEWLAGGMAFLMADMAAQRDQAARMTEMGQRTLGALAPCGADAAD